MNTPSVEEGSGQAPAKFVLFQTLVGLLGVGGYIVLDSLRTSLDMFFSPGGGSSAPASAGTAHGQLATVAVVLFFGSIAYSIAVVLVRRRVSWASLLGAVGVVAAGLMLSWDRPLLVAAVVIYVLCCIPFVIRAAAPVPTEDVL